MRAITQQRYGGADALHLDHIPVPVVNERQVLVRVAAAGLDRGTYHVMRGRPYLVRLMGYGLRSPKQRVPGTNFAGCVEATGPGVERYKRGDEVYGTCHGAFAEFAVADEDRIALKPDTLSCAEAAVLPYPGAVSLQAILDRAEVRAGHSVLVVGASGAVGTIAVQIAKACGAHVTGVCSTGAVDLVQSLGVDDVVDYTREDFAARAPFDVILDIGGNTKLSRLRRALAPHGTLVIVGGEGGGRLLGGFQRQVAATMVSPFVGQRLRTIVASEDADLLRALNVLVADRLVTPVMGRCLTLEDAAAAVRDLDRRDTRGRLAIVP